MKVRIVSDGTVRGTQVRDADTGELIEGVYHVDFSMEAGTTDAMATVEMYATEFDCTTEADVLIACPMCKRELYQPVTSDDQEPADFYLSPDDPLQLPEL